MGDIITAIVLILILIGTTLVVFSSVALDVASAFMRWIEERK